jgi:hypothetical protein
VFQIPNRVQRPPKRRRRVWFQRVLLRLDRAARSRVRPSSKALSDDPRDACGTRGLQQILRAFSSQPIRQFEFAIETA